MIRPPAACPGLELFAVGDHIHVQVSGSQEGEQRFLETYRLYEEMFACGPALAMELAADELELTLVFCRGR